jgi:hypothetical protein
MNDQPTAMLAEPTTNENGVGKKGPSPTLELLMFNSGGAGTSGGDRCTARKG